jgi:hypothetical protein
VVGRDPAGLDAGLDGERGKATRSEEHKSDLH